MTAATLRQLKQLRDVIAERIKHEVPEKERAWTGAQQPLTGHRLIGFGGTVAGMVFTFTRISTEPEWEPGMRGR